MLSGLPNFLVRSDFLRDFLWFYRRFPEWQGKPDSSTGLTGWDWHDLDLTKTFDWNFHHGHFQFKPSCFLENWKTKVHKRSSKVQATSGNSLPTSFLLEIQDKLRIG